MKKALKSLIVAIVSSLPVLSYAQETITLNSFEKIIASPHVNLILAKGDKESIRFEYNDIPQNKVNVVVKGNKLRIYLDHARITERQVHTGYGKHGIYNGSSVTAYVHLPEIKSSGGPWRNRAALRQRHRC
ncbi:MAG: DUF2807 domain-containing protein [Bacteroidota bacterium]